MLKRLGRQLTLLNVLISGAILVAMALVSLGVTENMMRKKNEFDLQSYMGTVLSAVRDVDQQSMRVLLKVPQSYSVFVEDADTRGNLVADRTISEDVAEDILPDVRKLFDVKVSEKGAYFRSGFVMSALETPSPDSLFVSFGIEGEAPVASLTTTSIISISASDYQLSTIDNVPYRIAAATIGDMNTGSVLMVMQDRSEELRERDRLRLLFTLCVAGGLALIVLSSLLFSAKAVRPIESSIRRQQEFVSAASHELRTPIASVRANAEVLGDAELGEYAPYLGSILAESENMTRLVSDLLSLARSDAGELPVAAELLDVSEVAGDALALMAPLAREHDQTLTPDVRSALILGDADRLRQILIALMDNAVRYTQPGGEVVVRTAKRDGTAEISVEDNGPGIPDEHKGRIFDRFYRVDTARSRAHGGAGLGLSIAQELARRMGGEIRVMDRPGGGCRFVVCFPSVNR